MKDEATYHRVHGHRPPLALWLAPAALHPGDDGALQAGVVVGLGGALIKQAGADPVELHLGAVHLVEHWHREGEDAKKANEWNPKSILLDAGIVKHYITLSHCKESVQNFLLSLKNLPNFRNNVSVTEHKIFIP